MPFDDGIPRINCYSLTDFYTFDFCPFRFFVSHHLQKKYEIEEGNYNMALGSLLDETIKLFHKTKSYGQSPEYIKGLIKASLNKMLDKIKFNKTASFYSSMERFLKPDLSDHAAEIFINYYQALDQKIKPSLGEVEFCELVIDGEYKLWGWPDAYEMGEDGIPEICDYKYREDIKKGKESIEMDLMPKIYLLLCRDKLLGLGYQKARFVVRFWTDPKEQSFYEEFELEKSKEFEQQVKQRINKILAVSEVSFCEKDFCKACKSEKKLEFANELQKIGIYV